MSAPARPVRASIEPEALRCLLALHGRPGDAEPCALLLGRATADSIRVEDAVEVVNAHPRAADAFAARAEDVLEAARRARREGRALVGAYHGHGIRPADLSRADEVALAGAAEAPGADGTAAPATFLYVLSGRGAGRATVMRAYVARERAAVEVPLRMASPARAP